MKKQPDLSILTIEELHKKAKTSKMASGALAGILIVQLAVGIYLTILQGFNVFIVIPIAFIPILILNFNEIKKINAEIARRSV